MNRPITAWAVCLAVCSFGTSVARGDDSLSLEDVLARHRTTIERLHRCSVKAHERWVVTLANGTPEQIRSIRDCELRQDKDRANLLVYEVNYPPGILTADAGSQGYANEFNYVRNGQVLEIYYPREVFDVRPDHPAGIKGRLTAQTDDETFVQGALGNSAVAFGMATFLSPMPIAALVSLSKNGPITKDEFGYHVEGSAPDGTKHHIWFDPESSFVVRKLKFEQSGEALKDNRFQHNRRVLTARYGFAEKAVVETVTFEIHDVKVEPWQDTHVVTALETTKTVTATDGTKFVERTSHTLKDWNLDPDFSKPESFQPLLPVADGSRVLVQDTASLEYWYKDGKIELKVLEKTIAPLKETTIPPRPTAPRVQWIWAIVAGGLGLAWWRLRARTT